MEFPVNAPAAEAVFYRTYSRRSENGRECWIDVVMRNTDGLRKLGKLTEAEFNLLSVMQAEQKALPSGRWLWVGGTEWIEKPENYSGAYNCTSTNLVDWAAFGHMMSLAMMGCGTGAIIEPWMIKELPIIKNKISITETIEVGTVPENQRQDSTLLYNNQDNRLTLRVGDSRQGWVEAYEHMLKLSSFQNIESSEFSIIIDLSHVRPSGEPLKGFGGRANPVKLKDMFYRLASILNGAIGRKLTSVECCLLIDEAAAAVVAGNIRRSAGMRQFNSLDSAAAIVKDNLWQQDEDGKWKIDPERDALRMANHTRVFHRKPTREEVRESVTKQFYSGEGAIQYAPEAIARANCDILSTKNLKHAFLMEYGNNNILGAAQFLDKITNHKLTTAEIEHRIGRYGLNPCGEIIGSNFHCNLAEVHLNLLDPNDLSAQIDAFEAASISVAALLHHKFEIERYQISRDYDPIIGVSFTGLFDFFVNAFGIEWLNWWEAGRPSTEEGHAFKLGEREFFRVWRNVVETTVKDYCERHKLKVPNRCTTVQPAGTKSLLTGASPGWHPPKAQRFIRRITFRREDPVALACMDYGYSIVPSQSDKDEQGRLLDDPFDPRCTEWLVEIPTEVSWANLPGADRVEINNFSALAQFDFYMNVQQHYTGHNTSATIEFREDEIIPLADRIYEAIENNEGYISAALLARFDANETFPRLPFEPISKEKYDQLTDEVQKRRRVDSFHWALANHDKGQEMEAGPAGCDSDKCLIRGEVIKPE